MNPKKTICLFAILLLGSVALSRAASASDSAIAAVIAAEKARGAALVAHDLDALRNLIADDFNYTHSNNHQETKATHIDSLAQGLRYTKFETSALRARLITPDVVTLNGFFDQIKGRDGDMKEGRYLFLAVWRRNGNRWQLTTLQSAQPPAPAAK